MENGYLTYEEPRVDNADIDEIADSIQEFSDFFHDNEADFIYFNDGFL